MGLADPIILPWKSNWGHRHVDLVDRFNDVLQYYNDYCWGARYLIKKHAPLTSSKIKLFKEESALEPVFVSCSKKIRCSITGPA